MSNLSRKVKQKIKLYIDNYDPYIKYPIGCLYTISLDIQDLNDSYNMEINNIKLLDIDDEYKLLLINHVNTKFTNIKIDRQMNNLYTKFPESVFTNENKMRVKYLKTITIETCKIFELEYNYIWPIVINQIGDGIII